MSTLNWVHRSPWTIIVCSLSLVAIGISGIARGDGLAGAGEFAARQCIWVAMGLATTLVCAAIPYKQLKPLSYQLFGASLVLLVVVYFMPMRNGSQRWIPLGLFYFQPSEMAKIAYILALAHYLMYRRNYRNLWGLFTPFALTLVPVALILREPDLGTSLLFFPVLFAMLFAAGARSRHLALVVAAGFAVLPLLWVGMSSEQKSRVVALFIQQDGGEMPQGDGYHLYQSKQMLALGGTWGSAMTGPAVNDPSAYRLPAARTDFIFCLVGERWGLIGCSLTMLLYAVLFARGLMIAAATREPFGRLISVGIVALLAAQTAINTGMTVGLMPITGMTLPLLSYGGSSLLSTCCALGLLINVAMRPGYEVTADPFRFRDKPRR